MNPLWGIIAVLSLLLVLAWRRIYPDRLLLQCATVPAVLSLILLWTPAAWPLLLAIDGAVFVIAAIDLVSAARISGLTAERTTGHIASLGKTHHVELTITSRASRPLQVTVRDGVPPGLAADVEELEIELPAQRRATIHYSLRAQHRGAFALENVHLKLKSRWGLWKRMLSLPASSTLHVYPDMKQLGEYALLARTNRLSLMGVRRTRKIGQDNEFERLRDYTRDDNFRNIAWRATARRRKLTVKDFQSNQSQRIVFLVDCGRMMTGEADGVSLLDHSLNAMLMLSYVALRQGDQVGLLCFSNEIHGFVPPRGGSGQMNRLLHASFDRFPQLVESRYEDAFFHVGAHVRRRSLVVLITNVIDEVNSLQIERHLAAIAGRHLPLGVLLRDRQLFKAVDRWEETPTGDQPAVVYEAAAAADILSWRRQVLANLQMKGVLMLDLFPEEMTAPLVNEYLNIKARHLL